MADLLRYTQEIFRTFIEVNGKYKINANSPIAKRDLNPRSMAFLENFLGLMLNSKILSKASKIYITSIESEPMEAITCYNAVVNEFQQINKKKASNAFYNDRLKLKKLFCDDMLYRIIYDKAPDLEAYEAMLKAATDELLGRSLLGKLTVLHLSNNISTERPTEEELDKFLTLMEIYSVKSIKAAEETVSKNVIGYVNYIATCASLTQEDAAWLEKLKEI